MKIELYKNYRCILLCKQTNKPIQANVIAYMSTVYWDTIDKQNSERNVASIDNFFEVYEILECVEME